MGCRNANTRPIHYRFLTMGEKSMANACAPDYLHDWEIENAMYVRTPDGGLILVETETNATH